MSRLPARVRYFLSLERTNDALFVLFSALGIGLLSVLAVVFLHATGWWALVGLVPIALIVRAAISRRTLISAAQRIESGFPQLSRKLVPAVQLAFYRPDDPQGYSVELAQAAVDDAWGRLEPLPLERLVAWRRTLFGALILLAALALAGTAWKFAPDRIRSGLYWSFAPASFPLELSVEPGHVRVDKGQDLTIAITARSPFDIRQARLVVAGKTEAKREVVVGLSREDDAREWTGKTEVPVNGEFDYQVLCSGRKSAVFHVALKQPLEIVNLGFRYVYPAYSRLPVTTSQSREVAALTGTRVEIKGEADQELAAGELAFGTADSAGTVVALKLDGRKFTGEFMVRKPGEFELKLTDVTGTRNSPERFRVTPINDEYPFVRLFAPGADMNLPSSMQVMLGANSVDDYGLTALSLYYVKDSVEHTVRLKQPAGRLEDTTFYLWDLSKLGMMPGSTVRYYVVASDNDAVSGPKTSRSETFTLKFPTMTELLMQATQKTAEVESLMTPLSQQQQQLQQQTNMIDNALKRDRKLSWEDQQSMQNIMQNQDSLLQAIKQLREDVKQALDNMFQGVVLDSEALTGLQQLDTLLSQVLPKQMLQTLDSLRSAMERNPENMKAPLQKFQMTQAEMQQAIERAVELLQKLRQEQEMNNMARKAEELYEEQQKIQNNERKETNEQLARREEQVKQALDSLNQKMQDLAEELQDKELAKELQELAEQMKRDSMAQQAQSASDKFQQGKPKEAKQQGQKLSESLKSLRDKLKEMKESMQKKQSQDVSNKLMRAADDLLTLSDAQEGIERRLDGTKDLSDLVGEQNRLSDAARIVAETLAALSMRNMKIPPQLGEPIIKGMRSAEEAAQAMEGNNAGGARAKGQALRGNLNTAVEKILKALQSAQAGGGFGGGMESFLQQLSQSISGQMGIGQQLGGMMPIPMPGGGMSQEMMQAMQELMARQQALREALEQAMQSMGGKPGMTSSIEAAIEEMKQLEQDMANPNPQRPYVERSERITNKLLDAQRSIRQREFSEERESESGKVFTPPPSARLPEDLGERKKKLREELMRALKDDFPREYEPYVRAYFEALLKN